MLEPYEGKLSCTVLRGEGGSNALDLPDRETFDFSYEHIASLKLSVSCVLLKELLDFRELT